MLQSSDVVENQRAEKAIAHLAAIVESSDDAIVSWTLQGNIVSWNSGAERMYGYCAEEVLGKQATLLLPPHNIDEPPHLIERIKRGERIMHYETVRIRKNGTLIEVSLSVSPIREQNGNLTGISVIGRDITERKQAENELKALRQEAQDLRQALEERKVIERAKGILMKRSELDEPDAFRRLQRLASEKRRKLVDIAQMIVTAEEAFTMTGSDKGSTPATGQ
jgi:PAS domain S-box-containing protein